MQSKMEAISKSEALELVTDSISSIFTKHDVLELINRIDAESNDVSNLSELKEFLADYLSDALGSDSVDLDSAEFELDGNTITLTNVEVDTYSIESAVRDAIDEWKKN
jgi:hypothetical protein